MIYRTTQIAENLYKLTVYKYKIIKRPLLMFVYAAVNNVIILLKQNKSFECDTL